MIYVLSLDLWLLWLVKDVNAWHWVSYHFNISIIVDIVLFNIFEALSI